MVYDYCYCFVVVHIKSIYIRAIINGILVMWASNSNNFICELFSLDQICMLLKLYE